MPRVDCDNVELTLEGCCTLALAFCCVDAKNCWLPVLATLVLLVCQCVMHVHNTCML